MGDALEGIVDKKIIKVLGVFIKANDDLFHIKKVSELSNVPIATSFRIIRRLAHLKVVEVIKINKFKVYRLAKNQKTKVLAGILKNE